MLNGLFVTRDDSSTCYAIIRHNIRTFRSAGVVSVVKGKQNAESQVRKFEESQNPADRHEGWRYFIEKSTLKAGTDPTAATHQRQAELELRESKATEEPNPSNDSSPDPDR